MARRIIRNRLALRDLEGIWSYIAPDSVANANQLMATFDARWKQLIDFPYSGKAREDIGPGVRSLLVGEYITLYAVEGENIRILRVHHGRQKIDSRRLR